MKQLILDQITIQRSKKILLDNVSAIIPSNQIVGVLGPNGAGKSSLLKAIAGQIKYSGSVRYQSDGKKKIQTGYLPQNCTIEADLTVMETILLGFYGQLGFCIEEQKIKDAANILEDFQISDLSERSMQSLSGGQQQLVLLAQRILRQPQLLILDESTSALDTYRQLQVFKFLRNYVERTGALVLISIHDLNLAARHINSVLLLNTGRLIGSGTFEHVLTADTIKTVYGIQVELLRSNSGVPVIFPISST